MTEGQSVIVTGSAGGIGRAAALEFVRQGARGVVVTDVNDAGGQETVELIRAEGGDATFVQCDLAVSDQIAALVDQAAKQYDGIDILVNNAAVLEPRLTDDPTLEGLPEDVWDKVFDVNLKAMWLATKFALPHLRASATAAVVNASSAAAITAYPGSAAYGAAKAGVVSLTRAIAQEFAADKIRCNCFLPAAIETPMSAGYLDAADDRKAAERMLSATHLDPRLGQPEEVAKLICFLASTDASFINGAAYLIDGGTFAWRGAHEV